MAGSGSGQLRGRSGVAGGKHGLAAGGWEKWRGGGDIEWEMQRTIGLCFAMIKILLYKCDNRMNYEKQNLQQ